MIITGIVIYTVHPPKTFVELNVADSKQLPSTHAPVTLMSYSYQNGSNDSKSEAAEAQVVSPNTVNSFTDQLTSRNDVGTPPADDYVTIQQPQLNSPSVTFL